MKTKGIIAIGKTALRGDPYVRLLLIAGSVWVSAASAATYTVTLPEGVTNTLNEAFANSYVTSSEGSPTLQGLYAASELQVTGGGRLEINTDLKTAGFAGEIRVKPGATLRITANGALGDTAHGTFVESGATLENECLDTSAINKLDFAGEPLTFEGTGVNGVGALVARTPDKQERNGVWGGTVLTMTGDAMISTVNGYQDFPCNSAYNSLDMNGHTLTVRGISNAKGAYPGNVCLRPVVTNPGHIVISNCNASLNDQANLGGSSANTLTVGKGCRIELYSSPTANRKKWTLNIDPEANANCLQTTSMGGRWDGPIVFPTCATPWSFGLQGQSGTPVYTNHSTIAGTITSAARLKIYNSSTKLANPYLTLMSLENSFAKGVSFANLNLTLDADGALPRNCGTAVVEKTSIDFNSSVAAYALPVLCVSNSATIGDGHGNWAGLVKASGATLTCSSDAPTFSTIELEAGTMTLDEPNRYFNTGLIEGHKAYAYWHKDGTGMDPYRANAHCDGAENCHTNQITSTVRLAYVTAYDMTETATNEQGNVVKANGYAFSYTGYIWNPDPTNVTWSFAASQRTVSKLYINGTDVYGRQGTETKNENVNNSDLRYGNATLKPGANHFWWRIGVSGTTVGPNATVKSCATWTDHSKFGLVYDRLGRKSNDPANYERLVNTEDGALFTMTDPSNADYAALKAKLTDRSVERMVGHPGSVLNARGRRFSVGALVGCPTVNVATDWVSDAGLTVTGSLTARTADILAARHLTTDGTLTFGAGTLVSLDGDLRAFRPGDYVLAVAGQTIETLPQLATELKENFALVLSDDGKTLYLRRLRRGCVILFR